MKGWTAIVSACRRGDAAAWREFVRATLAQAEWIVRQLLARAHTRVPPSVDDVLVSVYNALRRDHGRPLHRFEDAAAWPLEMALLARRAVLGAVGNVEGEIPTRAASEEAARAWRAYRETPLEPDDRVLAALFYFRGMRYVDIAQLFDRPPAQVSESIRRSATVILARYEGAEPGAAPSPRGASCPTSTVLFDFVHREVAEESRRVLTGHADTCPACRALAERYRRLLMGMASVMPTATAGACLNDDELRALVERRVPPESRVRLGGHLGECAACWEGFDFLRAMAEAEGPEKTARLDTAMAERILGLGPPLPKGGANAAGNLERFRVRRRKIVRQILRRQMALWGAAGFLTVLLLAAAVWFAATRLRRGGEPAPAEGPPPAAGAPVRSPGPREGVTTGPIELEGIRGLLRVRSGGIGQGVDVTKKASVSVGDELVAFDDGAFFSVLGIKAGVREGTLRIVQSGPDDIRIDLEEGEAWFKVPPDGPGIQVRATQGRVETLRRPGYPVTFVVQAWRARTVLVVHDGRARLQGDEGRVEVTKGAWSSVRAGEGPAGISRIDTPPPPAWVEMRAETHPPPPYFDIFAPVTERVPPLLIAVPHATREPGAGRVAARMGRALDAPVLFGRWFEPADVIRPQETQWGPSPQSRPTTEAREIYQLYRQLALRASGAREYPLPLYVEVHGDELTGAGPVPAVEVLTRGFETADLERMRALWDRHPSHPPALSRVPLLFDLLNPVIRSNGQEVLFAYAGYPGSFAQEPGLNHVRRALILRMPRLLRFDHDMAKRYGEILADVVREAVPAPK